VDPSGSGALLTYNLLVRAHPFDCLGTPRRLWRTAPAQRPPSSEITCVSGVAACLL